MEHTLSMHIYTVVIHYHYHGVNHGQVHIAVSTIRPRQLPNYRWKYLWRSWRMMSNSDQYDVAHVTWNDIILFCQIAVPIPRGSTGWLKLSCAVRWLSLPCKNFCFVICRHFRCFPSSRLKLWRVVQVFLGDHLSIILNHGAASNRNPLLTYHDYRKWAFPLQF